MPDVSVSRDEIARAAELLASGTGPFAVDAERASGFRYSNRAYLLQIRRAGAGTVLIDPVSHGVDSARGVGTAWPRCWPPTNGCCTPPIRTCRAWPRSACARPTLYDTELAGRLANYDRVNLAAMVQRLLGLQLTKGHGAADWSKRPLPDDWLNYAALDVEVLVELRDAIAAVLEEQGKTDWARQEFEFLRTFEAAPTRRDRWRRTSGIHKVRNPRALAAVRELWTTRDQIARRRDIAPGRILPDSAIINAATVDPDTVDKLTELPIFGGSKQRRSAAGVAGRAGPRPGQHRAAQCFGAVQRPAARVALGAAQAGGRRAAGGSQIRADRTRATGFGAGREPAVPRDRAAAVLGLGAGRRHRSRRRHFPAGLPAPAVAARADREVLAAALTAAAPAD